MRRAGCRPCPDGAHRATRATSAPSAEPHRARRELGQLVRRRGRRATVDASPRVRARPARARSSSSLPPSTSRHAITRSTGSSASARARWRNSSSAVGSAHWRSSSSRTSGCRAAIRRRRSAGRLEREESLGGRVRRRGFGGRRHPRGEGRADAQQLPAAPGDVLGEHVDRGVLDAVPEDAAEGLQRHPRLLAAPVDDGRRRGLAPPSRRTPPAGSSCRSPAHL